MQEKQLDLKQFLEEFQQGHSNLVSGDHMSLLFSPLERIKIILQVQDILEENSSYSSNTSEFDGGVMANLGRIWEDQGFFELWRGFSAKLIKLVTHNYCKKLFDFFEADESNLFSSGVTRCLALLVSYPCDLIRVRMAADVGKIKQYGDISDCFTKISQKEGLRGLYWGLTAGFLSIVAFRVAHNFTLFLQNRKRKNIPAARQTYLATGIGLLAAYPFQTVKNRMILMAGRENKIYNSTLQCIKSIYEQEGGLFTFYKGFGVEIKTFAFTIGSLIFVGGIAMFTLLSFIGRTQRQRLLDQLLDQVEKKFKHSKNSQQEIKIENNSQAQQSRYY